MGTAKFTAVPGLDEIVARMIAPEVDKIAGGVQDTAKRLAPPTKKWISMRDARVRRPHRHADNTEIPDNLRFHLEAYEWDLQHPMAVAGVPARHGDGSGWDGPEARTVPGVYAYLRHPRDETARAFVQIVNCRCRLEMDPDGVARLVKLQRATVIGTKVRAVVYAEGELVMEAEYGDVYPGGLVAEGTFFMHRAAAQSSARR